jgi:hypothetical protein
MLSTVCIEQAEKYKEYPEPPAERLPYTRTVRSEQAEKLCPEIPEGIKHAFRRLRSYSM